MDQLQNHKRILVVDDEESLCEILQFNLEGEGFKVTTAYSAEEALEIQLDSFDLFLLDVMMGKMSGFKLAEHIRKNLKITTPIIFITAKDTENDLLTGFNLGADDYISKPFSIKELTARVKAILRRTEITSVDKTPNNIITVDNLTVDFNQKRVTIGDKIVDLTKKEFEIFSLFIENQNRIFNREDILLKIWSDDVIVTDRTVDVNIARLRKKLGDYSSIIKNKPGYGYYFNQIT